MTELPNKAVRIVLEVWATAEYSEADIRRDVRRFFGSRGAALRLLGHTYTSDVEWVDHPPPATPRRMQPNPNLKPPHDKEHDEEYGCTIPGWYEPHLCQPIDEKGAES